MRGLPLEIWGDGKVIRDYVYVDDVMDAIEKAIYHDGDERVFNIGTGVGVTLLQIIETIEALIGHPLERIHYPARGVDAPVSVVNCSRAAKDLGWTTSTDLAAGIHEHLLWMRQASSLGFL
jgi:UDP-glucose 4-epimerase